MRESGTWLRTGARRQEVAMRRVIRWSDSVGAHRLWAAVAAGVPPGESEASDAERPRGVQQLRRRLRRQRGRPARRGGDDHRRVPQRAPRPLPVLGRRQPEQPAACGRSPISPRSCSTANRRPYQMLWEDGERFRVAKIGDPDQYLSSGTHVFEIRYTIAGVLDPGTTGADKTFAESDRRGRRIARPCSTGTSSPSPGTTGSNAPTSRSRCPATSAGRSVPSASASARPAAT